MGRLILGVGPKTANDAVRGELGLWTMAARRDLALLRWWGKLVRMDPTRICARVYRAQKERVQEKKSGWCKKVRDLLTALRLGHLWFSEETGDVQSWSALIKAKIAEREMKEWRMRVEQKDVLRVYQLWKSELKFEDYLCHFVVVLIT